MAGWKIWRTDNNRVNDWINLTSRWSTITEAQFQDRLQDTNLGIRARFAPTIFVHTSTAGGVTQNDLPTVDIGGGDVGGSIGASPAGGSALTLVASSVQSALISVDATFTVTYSSTTNKVTVARTGNFTLRTTAANTIWGDLGFDTGADKTGAATYTSDNGINGMGHFIKLKSPTTGAIGMIAVEGPRYRANAGDTGKPSSKASDLRLRYYTHSSDLGDDPRLWATSATDELSSLSGDITIYQSASEPDVENELLCVYFSTNSTDAAWHYIELMDDTSDLAWLEVGWVYAGPTTEINSAKTFRPGVGFVDELVFPTASPGLTERGHEYLNEGSKFHRFGLDWGVFTQTEVEAYRDLRRDLGRGTPFIFCLDPDLLTTTAIELVGNRNAYLVRWDSDHSVTNNYSRQGSWSDVLKQIPGGAPP